MPARLIERDGEHAGRSHALMEGVTTIGRDEDNDVVIARDHVSRHHAEVRWDGARFLLADLDSKNGTLLNGGRVCAPEPLRNGDEITLPGRPGLTLAFAVTEATVTLDARPADGGEKGLRLDTRTAVVWLDGRAVQVSAKEYHTLVFLAERRGGLVTKTELAERVWPEVGGAVADYSVEQLVSRLRHKLEPDPANPRFLLTVRGLGYRLAV
jgi:hypothetical protein